MIVLNRGGSQAVAGHRRTRTCGQVAGYPPDEPETFVGMWGLFSGEEQRLYHQAGLWLCDPINDLFATRDDPTAWPLELRAVVRFMLVHNWDPEEVLWTAMRAAA